MAWLVLWLACAGEVGGPSSARVALELSVSDATPTVPVLAWDADVGAVEVTSDDGQRWQVGGVPADGIAVLGLKAGHAYDLGVVGSSPSERFVVPEAPASLSYATAEAIVPGGSALGTGGVMMAIAAEFDAFVAVMDAEGDWVWWTEADPGLTAASPRETLDGTGVLFAQHERERVEDLSIVTRLSWDGRARADVRTPTGHHMAAELPGGDLAFLGHRVETHSLDGDDFDILTDTIVRIDADGTETVLFDFFDTGAPYVPCAHGAGTIDKFGWEGVREWTHANSLVHDTEAGLFYVLARHLDALLAIDDTDGSVVWRLGGLDATRAFADPAQAFDHGHTSWVTPRDAWVFDNGVHAERPSRLVHYDLSVDPVEVRWTFEETEGRTVNFLGDVQAAPNGHVLGAWTVPGDVTEHDATGQEVWRARLGPGAVLGRIRYVELRR